MHFKFDLDCTPEEARAFLGLADLRPMQDEVLKQLQERMTKAVQAMEPEEMLKWWAPATLKGFEQWREMFLSQFGAAPKTDKAD